MPLVRYFAEAANGQGIHIYEHVTKVVRLPKEGYIFPLKQRYDYVNTTLEGLRHAVIEPGDLPEFVVGIDTEPGEVGVHAESSGSGGSGGVTPAELPDAPAIEHADAPVVEVDPVPEEHWAFDKRGKRYRCDEYGINIVPGSTRPEGLLPADWKI